MFQPFICGASDPQGEADDRRKSRKNSFSKNKGHKKEEHKNPYSDRGLDKFYALLAELEEKKQKIYSQTGSQDISFVRFTYKNSTDFVPIVVKFKDKKEKGVDTTIYDHTGRSLDSQVIHKHTIENLIEGKQAIKKMPRLQSVTDQKKQQRFSGNIEFHKWRRPSFYVPAFLVLILLLLVFFGRSVSILFTCIAWYMVPITQGKSYDKKKIYVRKLSDNKPEAVRDKSFQIRDRHSGNLIK